MNATLNVNCPPRGHLRPPQTIRYAKLHDETMFLRELRRQVDDDWFELSLDERAHFRAFPYLDKTVISRPSIWIIIQVVGRLIWHTVFDYEGYFTALQAYAGEAERLADSIRARMTQEDGLHKKLFEETDFAAVRASQGYAELRTNDLIPGSVEDLQRRREARRSRATG